MVRARRRCSGRSINLMLIGPQPMTTGYPHRTWGVWHLYGSAGPSMEGRAISWLNRPIPLTDR